MPSFSIDELSALKLVFSNTTVKDMMAAQVGYNDLASTDKTSSCSEMADVCAYALMLLK